MNALSYCGYRFPPVIIQHAVWLYLRFSPATLGLDLMDQILNRLEPPIHGVIAWAVEGCPPLKSKPSQSVQIFRVGLRSNGRSRQQPEPMRARQITPKGMQSPNAERRCQPTPPHQLPGGAVHPINRPGLAHDAPRRKFSVQKLFHTFGWN